MKQQKFEQSDYALEKNIVLERWLARAAIFELLAMGLLIPTSELARALSSGDYAEAYSEVLARCDMKSEEPGTNLVCYEDAEINELFHELRREYTHLFTLAPEPRIMPYLGVWADREQGGQGLLFLGKETVAIEHFMRRCGVAKDVSLGQVNDPVDHIGTVCEFMKYLCLVNARAIQPADTANVDTDDFAVFHLKYFAPYALWCANQIRSTSSSRYYLFVADALELTAECFGRSE